MHVSGTFRRLAIRSIFGRAVGGRGEAEFVVVAAREDALQLHVCRHCGERLRAWHEIDIHRRPHLRALQDMQQVAGEAVGNIERGMRDATQRNAERHARFGLFERIDRSRFVGSRCIHATIRRAGCRARRARRRACRRPRCRRRGARSRDAARGGGTSPNTVMQMDTCGPPVVSPPINSQPYRSGHME